MGPCLQSGRSLIRTAASLAALPLRMRAGAGASRYLVARHRAVARRVRKLHAAHGARGESLGGDRLANLRLHGHQYRHRGDRHCRKVAGDREDEAWTLPLVGRLLLSLVAGETLPWARA